MFVDYAKLTEKPDEKCYVCGAESNIAVVSPMDDATGHRDMRAYCWTCFEEELDKHEQAHSETD